MRILLSNSEVEQVTEYGKQRQLAGQSLGLTTKFDYFGDGFTKNIIGALGEYALAKALKTPWNPQVFNYSTPMVKYLRPNDVGRIEVRTVIKPNNKLIIYETDSPVDIYTLMFINPSHLHVVYFFGWLTGCDGMRSEYFMSSNKLKKIIGRNDCEPQYWIPVNKLHSDIRELYAWT
jgi:hypothetical protein